MYLVRAPVPGGQYGESQRHTRPGQVPTDGISKQVHGVLAWQVAGTVGNYFTGHCHAVDMLQVAKATDLVKSCGPGTQNSNCSILKITAVNVLVYEVLELDKPVIVRMIAPIIMTNVWRVSV